MNPKYYLEYDDVEAMWTIMESDAGYEHGAYYDVMICMDECKPTMQFVMEALEAFPKTLGDYLWLLLKN